ncbi:unnamed protein product [Paramecium octaurelia]|uniref:H(+)-exporting diphosphatase n=1 Tax=Paramecium octaurelia TaxID=43137 RepID=A0A8S1W7I9_PAROT|nr:unnamed protein product [Paramecium octaurelia]
MFTDLSVYLVVSIFCVLAIALFLLGFLGTNFSIKQEEDYQNLILDYGNLYDEQEIDEQNWKQELPAYIATYLQTIEISYKELYLNQLIITIITSAGFLLIIASWLTPSGTFWGFFISFLWGTIITCIIAYLIIAVKIGTLLKIPIKASIGKEDVLKWIYGNGFFSALFIGGVITLNSLFIVLIMKAMSVHSTKPENYAIMVSGFPLGMLISGIYFREGMSVTGRGIQAACDLMIKKEQYFGDIGNNLSYTTKIAAGMSSLIAEVNFFDSMLVISLFVSMPSIVLVNSVDYHYSDNFIGKIFGIQLVFILSWVGQLLISFLSHILKNDDAVAFTANNVRCQILMSIFLSLCFVIFSLLSMPKEFEFGDKDHTQIYREKVLSRDFMGCGFIGIVVSAILIIYYEYLTSHGYSVAQKVALVSYKAPTLNIIQAYSIGNIGQIVPALLIALSLFISYKLASLVGILGLFLGYILNIYILMGIAMLGVLSGDGLKLSFLAQFANNIKDRLHSITWAAKNYIVWLKITNAGALIIAAILIIGTAIFFSKTFILLLNGYNLFGFLIGFGLAYYNKGLTIFIVKTICEEALYDEKSFQLRKNKPDEEVALENFSYTYFPLKNRQGNYYVLVNLLSCTLAVLFTGIIFGHGASISLAISNLFINAIMMFQSILTGTVLKNAFIYNSYDQQQQETSQVLSVNLYGDIQGQTIEESQNIQNPYYMIYTMLITLVGIELFKHDY